MNTEKRIAFVQQIIKQRRDAYDAKADDMKTDDPNYQFCLGASYAFDTVSQLIEDIVFAGSFNALLNLIMEEQNK